MGHPWFIDFLSLFLEKHILYDLSRMSRNAAVAEMSLTSGSFRPGRANVVLFVAALISRTAGYAIRMSGAVGGALSDGRPYPYSR